MYSQIYLPQGLGVADLVPRLAQRGVVITGGIHKENKGPLPLPPSLWLAED